MSIHHPFDAADPFGTRQDEKPPLGWPQGWDDQFWEDWSYVKRIMSDVFFLDQFRDGLKKGGTLRD